MPIMGRVMELIVRRMGKEERERMMERMIKNFFDDLSVEERQEIMKKLMSEMMTSIPILEVLKNLPMFKFMEKMVKEMEKEDFQPWKTCRAIEDSFRELVETQKEILRVFRESH